MCYDPDCSSRSYAGPSLYIFNIRRINDRAGERENSYHVDINKFEQKNIYLEVLSLYGHRILESESCFRSYIILREVSYANLFRQVLAIHR